MLLPKIKKILPLLDNIFIVVLSVHRWILFFTINRHYTVSGSCDQKSYLILAVTLRPGALIPLL